MKNNQLITAKRILLVRLGAIGDALRTLPAVRRLRVERPDATIAWAVEQWVYPVLAGNPNVDRFHVLRRDALRGGARHAVAETRRFLGEIRAGEYDTALDFHGRLKSGLVTWLSGARVRIGYARGDCTEGNYLFTNVRIRTADPWENRVLRSLQLLRPLDIEPVFDPKDVGLYVDPDVQGRARVWYEQSGRPALAVYPGTSRFQAAYHRWPHEKWIELLRRLGKERISTVVFWGPDDEAYARKIVREAGSGCQLAPATTLMEMMAMLSQVRAFVGTNSSAMHMAWLQGVPTAVFPGPAEPRRDSPLDCVPSRQLWAGQYFQRGRPKRYQPEVVQAVPVEEAFDAARYLLGARGG